MKLILGIVLVSITQVQAIVSQNTISLDVHQKPLRDVLKTIEEKSDVRFFYNADLAQMDQLISLKENDEKVVNVLNTLLSRSKLTYRFFSDDVIVIFSKPELRQPILITGTVMDGSTGETLPGVNILIEGTNTGVITDENGKYKLEVPSHDVVLVFSYIGYLQEKISVAGQAVVDVKLSPDIQQLDDVVVVAFGKQKRKDVIGSIVSIKPQELKVTSNNLNAALAGRVAGVIAYQRSGEPGQDNTDFFIRGVTTFGYKVDPLILIDGVESSSSDLSRLQVDDIASFSIMKDATSTALYGARGANGVILITTKEGTDGPSKISLRFENALSTPTKDIELADPVTYMKMYNEAVLTRNPLGTLPYSEEKIAKTEEGANPILFPANDWREMLLKDYATSTRFNLSLSGGGKKARYYVAGAYNQDNGIFKEDSRNNFSNNINYKTYSLRTNVNIDVTKSTELLFKISGTFNDYSGPLYGGTQMYRNIMRANPVLFPAYYPEDEEHKYVNHIMFGNAMNGSQYYLNPYADLVRGYKEGGTSTMNAQFEVKQAMDFLTEGLTFRTMVNTNRYSTFDVRRYYNPFYYELVGYNVRTGEYVIENTNETSATEYLTYNEGDKVITSSFYMESMLNYNRFFKKHGVSGLLVYMMRNTLNANAGDLQLSLPFRNLGLSGRATYSYDNRYFVEFNFGYNGSERFDESHRFGFFPSVGLAWSVSNEKFWDRIKPVVSNLRIRGTYGLVGNDEIGSSSDRFFYLSNVSMSSSARSATFGVEGGTTKNGISISRYANPDITWETAIKKNIALEAGFYNKVELKAEYFFEDRSNILMDRAYIPETMGLSATPRANVGKASGEGVDISLDYQHVINPNLWVSARGNFTYATSKYKAYEEPEYDESYRSRIGNSINQGYGYIAERLFVDDADAENSPKQNFGTYGGGDIKYTDINNDGEITEADIVPIGFPTVPEIVYGFGFSIGFQGIDFSAFFQGLAKESFWIDANATSPFASYNYTDDNVSGYVSNQLIKAYADDHWSEENQNIYALWPRLSTSIIENNTQQSTWFMRNGSFLRLKQVEIGYTIPRKIQDKIRTSNLRIYLSCSNLFLLSSFKLWDVEMAGNGLDYPIQRAFNLGINVNFN